MASVKSQAVGQEGFRAGHSMYHGMTQAILATTKKRLEAGYGGSVVDIPAPARNAKLVVVSRQPSD